MKKALKKGFTLTELIVVIVIIGILAAVLIPSLTGYIDKSKEAAAQQEASSYVTAHETWLIEKEETNIEFPAYLSSMGLNGTVELLEPTAQWEEGFIFTASNAKKVVYEVGANPLIKVTD